VDRESFPIKYATLMTRYSRLIGACDDYLQSHSGFRFTSVGRGRVRTIRQMMANAQREVLLLQTMGVEASAAESPKTWREIMFGRERAERNKARAAEGSPEHSAYSGEYTSIMSAESFSEMCGGELGDNERKIYDLLANIDKVRNPNFAAIAGYLDQLLEAIGPNPENSVLQLLKNQVEQRKMESDTGDAARYAVEQATVFARQQDIRTAMRNKVAGELDPAQIPENFLKSGEYSRVAFRMVPGDEETSRARLISEIAYYASKNSGEQFEAVKSGVREEFRTLWSFRLLDLTEAELMERYEEISMLEMSSMHLGDIGKKKNEQGRTVRQDLLSEAGMTEDMANCITAILGCYQILGRGLWTLRALDLGWIPTLDELSEKDYNNRSKFVENNVINLEKFREYIQTEAIDRYRKLLANFRNIYKDIIPVLMGAG